MISQEERMISRRVILAGPSQAYIEIRGREKERDKSSSEQQERNGDESCESSAKKEREGILPLIFMEGKK